MATVEDILLPDIGDFADVEVIEILVAPGERIAAEQSMLTLESEKATIEVPAPRAGVVRELKVQVGNRISRGDLLLTLETGADRAPEPTAAVKPRAESAPAAPPTAPPTARAPAPATTASVVLPDIGEFTDVPVVEILVAPGERIAAEQSILTLETEKATMEVPSPLAGVVEELAVRVGDTLSQGDLILTLLIEAAPTAETAGRDARTLAAESDVGPESAPESAPEPAPRADEAGARQPGEAVRRQAPVLPRPDDMAAIARGRKPHASPAVRRFARELGVDLARVKGQGRKGRILREDVQTYVQQALRQGTGAAPDSHLPFALPAAPEIDFARFGPIESVELSRIRKLSGRHLHRAWLTIPRVTQFDQADITELEAFRQARNAERGAKPGAEPKLTLLPFLLKAVAAALARQPTLKASLSPDGERLIMKRYTHIGVAVETAQGLVVPVLREVDRKGVSELASELAALSRKAREGKLLPGDMQGGCFSISSLGGIGGTAFTPIVNSPEVAILGVSRATMQPVWNGETFVPRLLLPLSLAYDHRVVDGAEGARFTRLLGELLGDIRRLLL